MTCNLQPTRRKVLFTLLSLPLVISTNTQAALEYPELRGLAENPSTPQSPFVDVGQGVRVQEVSTGSGEAVVEPGTMVSVKYVMRRSNGYFIDASYGFDRFETFNFRAGSEQIVPGFDMGVRGMKIGGRRRIVVPPGLGYIKGTGKQNAGPIPPDFGARRSLAAHSKEPILFEVQVVKIRS